MDEVDNFNESLNYNALSNVTTNDTDVSNDYFSNHYHMGEVNHFHEPFNYNYSYDYDLNYYDDWKVHKSIEMFNYYDGYDYISNYYDRILRTVFNITIYFLYVLIVIGALGNIVLLAVFCCHRKLRTPVNVYILNTAVSDLAFILCLSPIYDAGDPMFPRILSTLSFRTLIGNVAQTASVYSIAALSVERFLSVRRCSTDAMLLHKARMRWRVALVLAIWASTAAAKILFVDTCTFRKIVVSCVATEVTVGYVLPLLIISFFCTLTALRLRRISDCVPGESRARQLGRLKKAVRVVTMLVVNYVLCFTLEYLLMVLLMLWLLRGEIFTQEIKVAIVTMHYISICLRYLHSCINPIVLYYACSNWRVAMNKCVCYICRKIEQ